MGRGRRNKFMDDGSDSDNSDNEEGIEDHYDPDDPDVAAEHEFKQRNSRGRKRTREELQEEALYGDWAEDSGSRNTAAGGRSGRRADYTKAPSFISAGASSSKAPSLPLDNLSTSITLEPTRPSDEEGNGGDEDAMDLDSDVDSESSEEDGKWDEKDEVEGDDEEEENDLAPIPGLQPPPPPPVAELEASITSFAPRGIGSSRGGIGSRSGLGSGSAGIGARAGIGGGTAGRGGLGSSNGGGPKAGLGSAASRPLAFASATSASHVPLGGTGTAESAPPASSSISYPGNESPMAGAATPKMGLGAGRTGIGAGGIGHRPEQSLLNSLREKLAAEGATNSASTSGTSSPDDSPVPESPAADPSRPRQSFLPNADSDFKVKGPAKISKKEQQHFANLASSGSLGLRMLEKMGWKTGTGLGANEQGIVTPIGEGQKLRKARAGISKGERSAGAIAEAARMRGEDPDEIEENEKKAKKAAKAKAGPPKVSKDVWQQPKRPPKPKTHYKTYEEIVAESGAAEDTGVGMLVDLTGNALPSQSLSSLPAFGAGSADPTQLPELRHNLTLICSTTSSTLSAFAREGKGVVERRQYLDHEESRVRKQVEAQALAVSRLEAIVGIVEKVREVEKETVSILMAGGAEDMTPDVLYQPFRDHFDNLLGNHGEDYAEMRLDEVVVGAIAPIFRRLYQQNWEPLQDPSLGVRELKAWRRHFLIDKDAKSALGEDSMDVDVYGAPTSNGRRERERSMTAYETLMWTVWLPRIRSAINNVWTPSVAAPAVTLFTTWLPLLPQFLRDNILDQLILPKVSQAIADWSPNSVKRGGPTLHAVVFPWLEHVGDERIDVLLDEAKRKVRGWLKSWKASDGVPAGMDNWRDAFTVSDWDSLLLKNVLPQLGSLLRDSFTVNPRQQDVAPLEAVLAWAPLLRSTMMSQLLESGFFPKWLDALYVWLTSGSANFEQVADWYKYWKEFFPEDIVSLSGVSRGFRKGLDLMNQAMALGEDAKYRLKRPDSTPSSATSHKHHHKSKSSAAPPPTSTSTSAATAGEISFRQIVEEMASESNLVMLSTGRTNEKGRPLFRVSANIEGKGGVTVYLDEDVVFVAEEGGKFKPISVEEMVKRALSSSSK
ncbi:TFP11-domain-containing protein [Meredithblackwellia eburnea MCA 4105]